ncbi:MAG: TonB-dependent receptor, partial [Myxococcales bacterium]|nr:TonB-dependent receptor [Myxococcales bacterium]
DIPLDPAGGQPFDLSTIPPDLLEGLRVYRGGAPLWLGAGAIGGVLQLLPRSDPSRAFSLSAGLGSFGQRSLRASAAVIPDRAGPSFWAAAGLRHSDGDFPYLHDGGTRLDPSDDRERRRQNAQVDEGYGLARISIPLGAGRLEALGLGFGRVGGLLGSPIEEPTRARRRLARLLGALSYRLAEDALNPDWRLQATLSLAHERAGLADLYAEIGRPPRVTDDRSDRLFVRAAGERRLLPWLSLVGIATYSFDRLDPEDALALRPPPSSRRHRAALGLETRMRFRFDPMRLVVRASARLELERARLAELREERLGELSESERALPTFRIGLAFEPASGLALTAGLGTGHRLPTLLELFGDRAFVLGDTRLRPERATSVELGAEARLRVGASRIALEVHAFLSYSDDLVRWVRTAQLRLVPQNIAEARIYGLELGARWRLGRHLRFVGVLNLLESLDIELDRPLPLRPRLTSYLRAELWLGPASPWIDFEYVASATLHPAALEIVPARALLGAGVALELLRDRLRLGLFVRDVFDQRPFDQLGFPLPGRRFGLELTLREDSP